MTRTNSNLDASTKESFNKAIHLFATNDDVNNHKKRCLISLNSPVSHSLLQDQITTTPLKQMRKIYIMSSFL